LNKKTKNKDDVDMESQSYVNIPHFG